MQDLATAPPGLHQALAVLAPRTRFDLLRLVLAGPARSVSALAAEVGLSQSCTTRHLQALERAGFVVGTRDGKRVVFRAAPSESAARVLQALAAGETTAAAPAPRTQARVRRSSAGRRREEPGPVVIEGAAASALASDFEAHSDLPEPAHSTDHEALAREPGARSAAFAAAPDEIGQDDEESGKNSTRTGPPPRRPNDLEDYLL